MPTENAVAIGKCWSIFHNREGEKQMDSILHNRIRCKKCGEVIESFTVHDFKWCSCGAVAVDGGKDYLRRCGNREDYEDLSEVRQESE